MTRLQACIIIGAMYKLRGKADREWLDMIQRRYTQWLYDNPAR